MTRNNIQTMQWEAAVADCDAKIEANASPEIVAAAVERRATLLKQLAAKEAS